MQLGEAREAAKARQELEENNAAYNDMTVDQLHATLANLVDVVQLSGQDPAWAVLPVPAAIWQQNADRIQSLVNTAVWLGYADQIRQLGKLPPVQMARPGHRGISPVKYTIYRDNLSYTFRFDDVPMVLAILRLPRADAEIKEDHLLETTGLQNLLHLLEYARSAEMAFALIDLADNSVDGDFSIESASTVLRKELLNCFMPV